MDSAPNSKKYFRTSHTPWSLGTTKDDKRVRSVSHLLGLELVVTEKIDGENQTWTDSAVFARTHDGEVSHPSNGWSKMLHAERRHLIDPGLSVFLEYTFALHSIWYGRMAQERAYAHVFGVRDDTTGMHWGWDDVLLMAGILELPTVPVLFRGVVERADDLKRLMPGDGKSSSAWQGVPIRMEGREVMLAPNITAMSNIREGEVARVTSTFADDKVSVAKSIVKSVRLGHVQSEDHWKENWRPMHDWKP